MPCSSIAATSPCGPIPASARERWWPCSTPRRGAASWTPSTTSGGRAARKRRAAVACAACATWPGTSSRRARAVLTDEQLRLARHVVTENARTLAAAEAMTSGRCGGAGRPDGRGPPQPPRRLPCLQPRPGRDRGRRAGRAGMPRRAHDGRGPGRLRGGAGRRGRGRRFVAETERAYAAAAGLHATVHLSAERGRGAAGGSGAWRRPAARPGSSSGVARPVQASRRGRCGRPRRWRARAPATAGPLRPDQRSAPFRTAATKSARMRACPVALIPVGLLPAPAGAVPGRNDVVHRGRGLAFPAHDRFRFELHAAARPVHLDAMRKPGRGRRRGQHRPQRAALEAQAGGEVVLDLDVVGDASPRAPAPPRRRP